MDSGRGRLYHCLRLVLLAASVFSCSGQPLENDQHLFDWVAAHGGDVDGFTTGRECPTCVRGVLAARDFASGDVILRVPYHAILNLSHFDHEPTASEKARDLITRMHHDPQFNATWGAFWAVMPGLEDVLSPEVFTDELLGMLQSPQLEELVQYHRTVSEEVYYGTFEGGRYPPLSEVVPESKASLDTFKWVAALMETRTWSQSEPGLPIHMVPLLDYVNHHDTAQNAVRKEKDGAVSLVAAAPIRKGEAITINYNHGVLHRPDMSLFIYGFVVPRDPPLLCSFDLPPTLFNTTHGWFQQTPLDDSFYDDPASGLLTWEEHWRLGEILEGLPTTLEQDEALLGSGSVTGWKQQNILQFRVMRKKALEGARAKVEAALTAPEREL